jgi:hypothetical protein
MPFSRFFVSSVFGFSSPDLSAERRVVIYYSDFYAALPRSHRGSHASGASADHEDIEPSPQIPTHPFSLPCPVRKESGNFGNAVFH